MWRPKIRVDSLRGGKKQTLIGLAIRLPGRANKCEFERLQIRS